MRESRNLMAYGRVSNATGIDEYCSWSLHVRLEDRRSTTDSLQQRYGRDGRQKVIPDDNLLFHATKKDLIRVMVVVVVVFVAATNKK